MEKLAFSGDTPFNHAVENYVLPRFVADPERRAKMWDAIVPGVLLCPDLITVSEVRDVAVCTNMDATYGEAISWRPGRGPAASRPMTVVFDVDRGAYWNFVAELLGTDLAK